MSGQTLYDEDILLWSERQAEVIRRLRGTVRGLPNDLDVENVAEEIESVGRSELASVESYILLTVIHLMKLIVEPGAEAADHWRGEILIFGFNLRRRYAPSMRQRIDMNGIWKEARRQVSVAYGDRGGELVAAIPVACAVVLDDLLGEDMDVDGLVDVLKRRASERRE